MKQTVYASKEWKTENFLEIKRCFEFNFLMESVCVYFDVFDIYTIFIVSDCFAGGKTADVAQMLSALSRGS